MSDDLKVLPPEAAPCPSCGALVEALKYARNLIGPDEIVDAALSTHAAKDSTA